jgi:exosortase C (VPDSG-CTERM-specific)
MSARTIVSAGDKLRATLRLRLLGLALVTVALILAFWEPISGLARFSFSDELFSYIPLIPVISLGLIWFNRRNLHPDSKPVRNLALLFGSAGVFLLAAYGWGRQAGWNPDISDYLALMTAAFLLLLVAASCLFLVGATMRAIAFPAGFLVFAVPLPSALHRWIEHFLQYASADTAFGMFRLSTTPVFREGLILQLPAFRLEVAPECSGIHSTLVLFVTSVLAGHMFLGATWRRVLLTLSVVPLALLRNGFRIFVIGQACVHLGPQMIDSYIHRHGGPIFFVLSLIPFLMLLNYLRKSESRAATAVSLPKTRFSGASG